MNSKCILSIAYITSCVLKTCAFSSSNTLLHQNRQLSLKATVRPDATGAITDALRMSEEFGSTSKEARVAWDIVEEMNSYDTAATYESSNHDVANDYYDHIRSLSYLLSETTSKISQMKKLVMQIKDMGLADPSLAHISDDAVGKQLKKALAESKASIEVYGASSNEAKKAWDNLDNCFGPNELKECKLEDNTTYRYSAAALKAHHMYDAVIDTSLLDESIDALNMVQSLSKYVNLEKQRLDDKESSLVLETF